MENLIGKTVANRYRVDSLLGQGGMGNVYKVWDSQRRVFLAMKTLNPDFAEDKVFLRRFAREAETLAALQHPNIVRFYGLGQDGRLTFILMDYIEGTTLRGIIFDSQKPLSVNQVLQIIKPVCSALHYAHQNGRVHCDIKPANIMVKPNGEVLLADFGISRIIETHTTMTLAGAGTPPYMAPEQILVKKPVPQTDIYALGVILYEMLTGGERPFTGEQARIDGGISEKVMWEHLNVLPPSPRKYNPNISRQLELVVFKCLEKESGNRYDNIVSFLNALSTAIKGDVQSVSAKNTGIEVSAENIKKRPLTHKQSQFFPFVIAGIAIISLLILAFGVNYLKTIMSSLSLDIGSTMISEKDGMTMMYIPAGEFTMGSNTGKDDENPVHQVYLDAFWIDQTEVTNAMYAKCVSDGMCEEPPYKSSGTRSVYYGNSEFNDYPVILFPNDWSNWTTSWNMSNTYCEWRGNRLPTEEEWEKAARGTDGRTYPWGEGISCHYANSNIYCAGDTTKVGSYEVGKSPYGLYDMAGNVWEWVSSGDSMGRRWRGGSWENDYASDTIARSAFRGSRVPELPAGMAYSLGFRCAKPAP